MKAGQAHAWLFIDLINRHLREVVDPDDSTYDPDGCGPCQSLRDYWLTLRGRADAQVYLNQLSPGDREWAWAPGGVIDWVEIERRTSGGQEYMPLVTIKKKVYDELVSDQKFFIALQNAGVDNWEGWEHVLHTVNEEGS
jgi:hypothetical protein